MRDRDYAKEYRDYHAKPEQKKRRAMRNAARRMMEREGRVCKGDGKDVDHIDGRKRGALNNARKNLRVVSKSTNRSKQ